MPGSSDFLSFGTGGGANVVDQTTYSGAAWRGSGFEAGIAYSAQLNKVWRQSAFGVAAVAGFMAAQTGEAVQDNGDLAAFEATLGRAIRSAANSGGGFGTAAGTGNALTLALTPAAQAYTAGMQLLVLATAANTGAATINVDGLGAKSIKNTDLSALVGGEIASGAILDLVYDGTQFQLLNPGLSLVAGKVQAGAWTYAGLAGGTGNALTASITPTPAALTEGLGIQLLVASANTGPATLNLNGLGAKAITLVDGSALSGDELPAGAIVHMIYDGTQFQLTYSRPNVHASAWHQIAQTSITSVVAVDFTALGSTYDDLLIDMAGFGVPSAGVGLQIAFSSDGGSTWSTPQYLTGPTDLQTAGSPRYDLVALYTGWSRTRGVVASSGVGSNGGTPNALASSGVRPAIRIMPSVSGFAAAGAITIFGR